MWPPWSLASRLHHPEALVPPRSVPMGAQGLARRVPTVSPWCPPAPVPLCPPSQGGGSGGGHVEGPGARCSPRLSPRLWAAAFSRGFTKRGN